MRGYIDKGFNAIKLKVGGISGGYTVEDDYERVKAVRQVVGPNVKLMLDANQGWDVPTAIRASNKMYALGWRFAGRRAARRLKQFLPAVDPDLPFNYPSLCFIGAGTLHRVEINDLLLQEPARPLEVHGNLEAWLLLEALNDSFKANRRHLFLWVPEVCKQSDLGAGRNGLLERHPRPVNSDVVEHSLHFNLVVLSIRNLDGDRTSNFKSFGSAHREQPFQFHYAVTVDGDSE